MQRWKFFVSFFAFKKCNDSQIVVKCVWGGRNFVSGVVILTRGSVLAITIMQIMRTISIRQVQITTIIMSIIATLYVPRFTNVWV